MYGPLVYATNARIREIEQIYFPQLRAKSPFTPYFPDENDDADLLIWEQQDFPTGLMQWRGLDGPPPRVGRLGVNVFEMKPGYFGEHILIGETELTKRRAVGTFADPIDVTEPQIRAQKQLMERRSQLVEKIVCDLVSLGLYQIADLTGQIVKAAGFAIRTFVAVFPWSNWTQSTPLADMTSVRFFGRGFSADFGAKALAVMNLTTFSNLRQNQNAADLYGRRTQGLATPNSMAEINTLFAGDGLPQFIIYDEGYYDDTKVFRLFVPDNTVVIIAPRTTGTRIGAFRYTRNLVNPGGAPGAYSWIVDRRAQGLIPPTVEVHEGFNGGPCIFFPSSVAVMHV